MANQTFVASRTVLGGGWDAIHNLDLSMGDGEDATLVWVLNCTYVANRIGV